MNIILNGIKGSLVHPFTSALVLTGMVIFLKVGYPCWAFLKDVIRLLVHSKLIKVSQKGRQVYCLHSWGWIFKSWKAPNQNIIPGNNFFLLFVFSLQWWSILESGINISPWVNVAPGKFDKKNKHSPTYTLFFYYFHRLYEVRNKAVAPEKK